MHASHSTDMLKSKVSDLSAPPQVKRMQCQHGGDVAYADIRNVDTPEIKGFLKFELQIHESYDI
jgi:hypothetical protein